MKKVRVALTILKELTIDDDEDAEQAAKDFAAEIDAQIQSGVNDIEYEEV